ncbi:MAG TPA: glycosyltransferase family 39 protein [Nitrososphaerales archaeon]|nr:glycosyltransferase family 39 protein [Nitrososphaerales archaeon]
MSGKLNVSMKTGLFTRTTLLSGTAICLYLALADFAFHMLIAGNYGYFRDELYYIVAGERLSFGYVDFPPMIALLAAAAKVLGGDSLYSIHVIPALAGSAIVFLGGRIARELGGSAKAQILASVAAMFSASFAVASIFSMDVLDMLWWTLLAFILIRITKREGESSAKLWIMFGVVAGIGLMTKLTIAFFLLSLLIGLALSPKRSYLKTIWPWVAGAIALLIVSPYVAWNALNGWPTVDFFIHHGGLNGGGPLSFLGYQVLIAGILGLPLVVVGLVYFFRTASSFSFFGIAFVVLLLTFTFANGKPYFLMGAYPFVFAGGAILLERVRRKLVWRTYVIGMILVGIVLAPLYAPVLPPQTFVQYYGGLSGVASGAGGQPTNVGAFPQYLGDRFGWDTMTRTVASVYYGLPAQERSEACILTLNYGEASALTFFGRQYGLPPVISGHNNYYIWGPSNCSGAVLIIVGYEVNDFQSDFRSISVGANITCTYCVPEENDIPVLVAIGLNSPAQSSWSTLKHYN